MNMLITSSIYFHRTSYCQSEAKLAQTNFAKQQLHQVLIWWDSLNMIEKRVQSNKEYVVQTTEAAIQAQAASYNSKSNQDDSDDDSDDGYRADGKN